MSEGIPHGQAFGAAAAEALQWLDGLEGRRRIVVQGALQEGAATCAALEAALGRDGVPRPQARAARMALAIVADRTARRRPDLPLAAWAAGANARLFEGRQLGRADLDRYLATAGEGGPEYAGLADYLDRLARWDDGQRAAFARRPAARWGRWAALYLGGLSLALGGYAAAKEWRYQEGLKVLIEDAAVTAGDELGRTYVAYREVAGAARQGPLRGQLPLPGGGAAEAARAVYLAELERQLPGLMRDAIADALAEEGETGPLYDGLRAWSILSGALPWDPAYLASWLAARPDPEVSALAPRVADLDPAAAATAPPIDPELLESARQLSELSGTVERALVELRRLAPSDIPDWRPLDEVPDLALVAGRRSGLPLATPLPGLHTQEGRVFARERGIAEAIARAEAAAAAIYGVALPPAPGAAGEIEVRLAREALSVWHDWLLDLRAIPFTDSETALRVSGVLGRAEAPLGQAIDAAWVGAGAEDPFLDPTAATEVAAALGPAKAYYDGRASDELAAIFDELNAALTIRERDPAAGAARLDALAERTRGSGVLGAAPIEVRQFVEDVLLQSFNVAGTVADNPVLRDWQTAIYPRCYSLTEGRYPFADAGAELSLDEFARLFGPGGLLPGFVESRLAPLIDRETRPWSWSAEARFEGLSEESAAFFQTAMAIHDGFFAGGAGPAATLTAATVAERGQPALSVGGAGGAVRAGGTDLALAWPGPDPSAGVAFGFGDGAPDEAAPGPWGLFRLLETVRLRRRDGGRVVLADLRADTGRVLLELAFDRPVNPLTVWPALRGLSCPAIL